MSDTLTALIDKNQVVKYLLLLTSEGCYYRDHGYWVPLDPGDETQDIENYDSIDAPERFIRLWDSAHETDGRLVLSDVLVT